VYSIYIHTNRGSTIIAYNCWMVVFRIQLYQVLVFFNKVGSTEMTCVSMGMIMIFTHPPYYCTVFQLSIYAWDEPLPHISLYIYIASSKKILKRVSSSLLQCCFPQQVSPAFQLLGILLGIVGPLCAIPDLGSCFVFNCSVWGVEMGFCSYFCRSKDQNMIFPQDGAPSR